MKPEEIWEMGIRCGRALADADRENAFRLELADELGRSIAARNALQKELSEARVRHANEYRELAERLQAALDRLRREIEPKDVQQGEG